jgi:hypothetical protein
MVDAGDQVLPQIPDPYLCEEVDMPDARCFYCDSLIPDGDAKLTAYGKIYGLCCADLGQQATRGAAQNLSDALSSPIPGPITDYFPKG